MQFAAQAEPGPVQAGDSGASASIANWAFRSWQQPRKGFQYESRNLAAGDVWVGPCVDGPVFPVSQGM